MEINFIPKFEVNSDRNKDEFTKDNGSIISSNIKSSIIKSINDAGD
jgi:hypothetical protein